MFRESVLQVVPGPRVSFVLIVNCRVSEVRSISGPIYQVYSCIVDIIEQMHCVDTTGTIYNHESTYWY